MTRGSSPAVALLAALTLTACTSKIQKADQYEAQFDRLIGVQAYPAAVAAMTQAIRQDDNEPRRWLKLGFANNALGRGQDAYAAYQHALDLAPDNVEALESLAMLSVRMRDFAGAPRYIDPLLVLSPDSISGQFAKGMVLVSDRKFGAADAIAQHLTDTSERPEGYVLRVMSLRGQARLRDAADVIEKRLALIPPDRDFLIQLLDIYRELHDVDGVRRTATALVPLIPGDPRYAMEAARALYAEGRPQQARAAFDAIAETFGGNPALMAAIGNFWRQQLPAAQAEAEIVRLAGGRSMRVQAALGSVLTDMGDAPAAVALLAPVGMGKIGPDNVEAGVAYARALLAAGRAPQAAARIADVLAFDTTNGGALVLRARMALARGDLAAALNDAQLAASGDQANEAAALLVATVYARMNNPALTAKAYGDAQQRFPASLAVIAAWTGWLARQGQAGDAARIAADYAHRYPESDPAWSLYGRLCRAGGGGGCGDDIRRRGRPA